jgi:hypothetical protein
VALLDSTYQNTELTGFVRALPQRSGISLASVLPNVMRRSRKFKIQRMIETEGASQYRAFDAPSRVVGRPSPTETTGQMPPMSESMVIGEQDTLDIFDRALQGNWDAEVVDVIENDARRLERRLQNRVEQARAQVLTTGKFNIAENGLTLEADFGVPAANLPGGDATTTAATAWSDPAADIIGELRALNERSLDEIGEPIDRWLVSSTIVSNMLLNTGIAQLLYGGTANAIPGMVTQAAVNSVLMAHGLGSFVEYNRRVNGTRLIDETLVVGLPAPDAEEFGSTDWGISAQALMLDLDFEQQPGIYGLVMKDESPPQKTTEVGALVMPKLNWPERLYVFDSTP